MMKTKLLTIGLAIGALMLSSCAKDTMTKSEKKHQVEITGTPYELVKAKNLVVGEQDWVYFSFEKATPVDPADPAKSTDWDVAFFAYYMKTNGGISGPGKGGVLSPTTVTTSFDEVKKAPTEGYVNDVKERMAYGMYPNLSYRDDSVSPILSGDFADNKDVAKGIVWLNPGNMASNGGKWPSVYAPTYFVYIIRTAAGKYVKFQVTDFYNDKAEAGAPSFQYKLSDDGTF